MLRTIVIVVFCTLAIIPIAGFSSNIISNDIFLIAFVFVFGYIALPAMLLYLWPASIATGNDTMEVALGKGNITTALYSTMALAEIKEFEDEGMQFLVEIDGGRTIFLFGQYLCGLVEKNAFPATQFRIFSNKVTGVIYGIEPVGAAIQYWPVYSELTESTEELIDGRIYDKTIAQLVDHPQGEHAIFAKRCCDGEQSAAVDGKK